MTINKNNKNNKNKKNIPVLRFTEFSGEWEKKKLGNVCKFQQGIQIDLALQIQSPKNGYVKFVRIENYTQNSDDFRYIPATLANGKGITKEEIAIVRYGATAGFIARGVDGVLANNLFKVIPDNTILNNDFLYVSLKREQTFRYFQSAMFGGAMPALSFNIASNLDFPLPTMAEQQKIASFITPIDNKIDQLTKNKNLLEQYKKSIMQQIFSQKIRFKDNDGNDYPDWEEKRFGEIFSLINTNSFSRENLNYVNGIVKNIHYGDIHTKFRVGFDITQEIVPYINKEIDLSRINEENYCREGDLIIADASEDYKDIGKAVEIIKLNAERLISGLHTFIARDIGNNTGLGFKGYLFQSDKIRKQIQKIATGISVLGISKNNLNNIRITLPSIIEQQKVVTFLTSIEKRIEAVKKQIEQIKIYKKGLLQQMFV